MNALSFPLLHTSTQAQARMHDSTVRAAARPRRRATHPTACGAHRARKGAGACLVDPPPRPANSLAQRRRPGLLRRLPGPPPPNLVRVSHPIRRPPAPSGATARVRGDERKRERKSEREAVGITASPCCCSGGLCVSPAAGRARRPPARGDAGAPTRDDGRRGEWRGDRGRSRPLSVSGSNGAHLTESAPEPRHRRLQHLLRRAVVIRDAGK